MTCACESIHKFPCQFPAETEFFRITPDDDREWCRFHLPLQDAEGNKSAKGCEDDGWKTRYVGLLSLRNTNGPIGGIKKGKELEAFRTEVHARLQVKKPTPPNPLLASDKRADLRGVVFPTGFVFGNIGIEHALYVNFEGATFGDHANFCGTKIDDEANFTDVTFGVWASFADATLGRGADFSGAVFGGETSFSKATFGDGARFNRATFDGGALFDGATFSDWAYFNGATFQGDVNFSAGKTTDAKSKFQHVDFSSAIFTGTCQFDDRIFGTEVKFNGAVFHDLVTFHGCTFHPGMSFHLTRFLKTKEDKFGPKKDNDDATEELERSYRTLKLEMEKLRARNEEADFFALEMECRRQRGSVPWLERFAATLYKIFSDYGRSVAKPLVWMGFLSGYGFAYFYHLAQAKSFRAPGHVLRFVMEQITTPFSIWRNEYKFDPWMADYLKECPLLVRAPATLMSLTAIALVTLFLLALRRRFKMD